MKSCLGRETLRDFVTSRSTPENWLKTFSTQKGYDNRRNLGTSKRKRKKERERESEMGKKKK